MACVEFKAIKSQEHHESHKSIIGVFGCITNGAETATNAPQDSRYDQ